MTVLILGIILAVICDYFGATVGLYASGLICLFGLILTLVQALDS